MLSCFIINKNVIKQKSKSNLSRKKIVLHKNIKPYKLNLKNEFSYKE